MSDRSHSQKNIACKKKDLTSTSLDEAEVPKKNALKVILNPNFKEMNEMDKRRTISIDKRFL